MKFTTALISVLSVSCVSAGTRGARKQEQEQSAPLGSASLSRWLMSSGGKNSSSGGKNSSSKNSSGSDDTDPCDVCADGKPDTIRLMYKLPSATSTLHTGNNVPSDVCGFSNDYTSNNQLSFNNQQVSVSDGDIITIERDFSGAWTSFMFDNGPDCQIHSSCSWPLVAGDQIGPFEVQGKDGCDGGSPPPTDDGQCVICDKNDDNNNERPVSLTMQYFAGAGENSAYQIESKHATCVQSASTPYPDGVTINAKDKNLGTFQTFTNVQSGDILVLNAPEKCKDGDCQAKFEANTYMEIEGWTGGGNGEDFSDMDTCHFHTSCSAPLVVGDQIGPFKMLAGNDCTALPEVPCIAVDKVVYDCGESISVSWDFASAPPTVATPYNGFSGPAVDPNAGPRFPAGLPDDQIGIWPCGLDMSDPPPTDKDFAIKTPEVWAWTCADYGDSPVSSAECQAGTAKGSGTIVFSDPEPTYVSAGLSHGFPVAPFYLDNAQTQVNECFQAILIRGRGPSVPPYVPVCASQEFTIKAGTSAECQIRSSSNSFPRTDP